MRTILADTHVALWALLDDPALPDALKKLATSGEAHWIFHQASLWEIQIKYDLGKLTLPKPPSAFLSKAVSETGFRRASIEDEGIFMLGRLPPIHRDPFDRLLIAHAVLHGWEVATTDTVFQQYPVRLIAES